MTAVLEKIKADSERQRAEAAELYREMIQRADNPEPSDVAELPEVLRTLGLTAADAEADAQALREIAALEARIPKLQAGIQPAKQRAQEMAEGLSEIIITAIADTLRSLNDPVYYEHILRQVSNHNFAGKVPDQSFLHKGFEAIEDVKGAERGASGAFWAHDAAVNRLATLRRQATRIFGQGQQ